MSPLRKWSVMNSQETSLPPTIDVRKRADQVRDRLVEMMRAGEYGAGDKLPTEPQLMEMFGVGRSSVRAAVQSLVGLGIVEVRPGRGTYVRRLSVDNLLSIVHGAFQLEFSGALHLHEVRAMIETTAARLAAHRRTSSDLDAMKRQIEQFALTHAAGNTEAAIEADLAFHRAMIASAHNPILLSLLDSISGILREHRREYGVPDDSPARTRVVLEHDAIVDALTAGDAQQSVNRVARHMRIIWDQIEAVAPKDNADSAKHPEWYFDSLVEDT